ncbi:MAG: protein adenylyltransferase SelO family protein [Alphaproteobacteria bacterium]
MDSVNIHENLGSDFYVPVSPASFQKVALRFVNEPLLPSLGIHAANEAWLDKHFLAFDPIPGSLSQPLALAYHGHQFRHYNPDIGDGRGFLAAQCRDVQGRILDFGTKGSGQTPFSREGDGRLTLQGGVREILASEELSARGVYTSRAFSLFETDDKLYRHDEYSPARAGVLTRVSHSHIRIGTFQRLAALGKQEAIDMLVDHVLRHYLREADLNLPPAQAMYRACVQRLACLCAEWMAAGFVHGVLNTDNLTVTGESFDYGPFRFLKSYDPHHVAAYFDHQGLYRYARQPESVGWALARLAETLLGKLPQDILQDELDAFLPSYQKALVGAYLHLAGLDDAPEEYERLGAAIDALLRGHQGAFVDVYAVIREHLVAEFGISQRQSDVAPTKPLDHEHVQNIWRGIHEEDDWTLFDTYVRDRREVRGFLSKRYAGQGAFWG